MTNPGCILALACSLCSCAALGPRTPAVVLDADSNIVVTRTGPAAAELALGSELLEKYLRQALRRDRLSGDGPTVTVRLHADALVWHQLPPGRRGELSDLDAFEIEVAATEPPTVQIRGSTVLAASFGVMHFLEHQVGITWLFPGDLGLDLPPEGPIMLRAGTERAAPDVNRERQRADDLTRRALRTVDGLVTGFHKGLHGFQLALRSLDPYATLQRGYALVQRDGHVVDSVEGMSVGERLSVRVRDGDFPVRVDSGQVVPDRARRKKAAAVAKEQAQLFSLEV